MKKFRVIITRTDEYDISIDPTIWNDEELKNWSSVFYPTENLEELASHLSRAIMLEGSESELEGFGYIKRTGYLNPNKNLCPGIEVDIRGEDDY
jgi:hypothetical protein